MSVMTDSTILACQQRATGSKSMETRVSAVILNVYQSTDIEKEDGSRQSLESHRLYMRYGDSTTRSSRRNMTCTVTWPRQEST